MASIAAVLLGTNEGHAALVRDLELNRMKKVQAYIAIRGAANTSENSDVPSDRMAMFARITRPVLNYRVNKTRWCVLRWPTPSMAQAAGMRNGPVSSGRIGMMGTVFATLVVCTMTGLAVSITGLYPVHYFRTRTARETELLADRFGL